MCEDELRNEREMTHSYKEVQFKCEECSYCGNNEVSMEVHVSKVHFEKKECGMCEYEAKDLEALELHLVTCQIYECKYCRERWQSISDIKKHISKEHKGQEFLRILHAKIDISNSDEVICKTYLKLELFPELSS